MNKLVVFCAVICGLVMADNAVAEEKVDATVKKADIAAAAPAEVTKPAATVPAEAVKPVAPAPVAAKAPQPEDASPNPAFCFGRGLSNLTLCWVEIPRCVVYDNAEIPFFGIIVGIPEGVLLTVARVGSGVFDILSFGFSGDALHGKRVPNFVWEAKWVPDKK